MKYIVAFVLSFISFSLTSQPEYDLKRDYVWKLGYDFYADIVGADHVYFDFNGDSLIIDSLKHAPGGEIRYANTSISDESGKLLFYSNGCKIYDAKNNVISGGEKINDGPLFEQLCSNPYPGHQSMLCLPVSKNKFFIFYLYSENMQGLPGSQRRYTELRLAELNRDQETEELEVLYADSLILRDTFGANLIACRHANGRDWWMILPEEGSNRYITFLISKTGIDLKNIREIGEPTDLFYDFNSGEGIFSPDGSRYIRFMPMSDLQIFDFDRCTGEFSDPIYIPVVDGNEEFFSAGAAVSSSNQFLYAISLDKIYQFDLWADSIANTKTVIGTFIPPNDTQPFWWINSRFFVGELAPDDKIYISSPGCRRSVHTIEKPNLKGLSCEFKQSYYGDLNLPIGGGLPNHPNFRLGEVPGSPCDTIDFSFVNSLEPSPFEIKVYPNPTNSYLNMEFETPVLNAIDIDIFDFTGNRVLFKTITKGDKKVQLDFSKLPNGMYFYMLKSNGIILRYLKAPFLFKID